FQFKLDFAAACDASALLLVLAALRMNRVVPLSLFPEDGDLHILQQTGPFVLEIGGLRGFHRENLLISVHLGKSEAVRAARYILRSRRRRFLLLSVSDPLAFEIHAYCQACQQKCCQRRPARVLRRFASLHVFSYANFRGSVWTRE